jgi:hypothetical protein
LQPWASCFTSIALVLRMRCKILVPMPCGKQKTPSKWETWVACGCDRLLLGPPWSKTESLGQ